MVDCSIISTFCDDSATSRPCAGKRGRAECAEYDGPAKIVALDRSLKFERHWHRICNRYFPGNCISIDATVKNLGRVTFGLLATLESSAFGFCRQSRLTLAHGR